MAQTIITPQQSTPSAATLTELYDVPDSNTFVGWLNICNRSSVPTAVRVSIEPNNAATSNEQYLMYDVPIDGNEVLPPLKIACDADDRIMVYNTLATCSFNLMGVLNS
jgi:hypothetical protein